MREEEKKPKMEKKKRAWRHKINPSSGHKSKMLI
jgi:hypothetical protein